MFSEKIQYNAPIPGEEFRARGLSVPAEAAKVLYEIDSQHGEDKDLCLAILGRTFRGTESVTKVLNECSKSFKGIEGVICGANTLRSSALFELQNLNGRWLRLP